MAEIALEDEVLHYLGGSRISGLSRRDVRDPEHVIRKIEEGFPARSAMWLRDHIQLERKVFYSVIPRQTIESASRRRSKRLSAEPSEKLYRAARMYALATEAFGDRHRGERWMATPNPALNGRRPAEYLGTDIGARQIETLLERMMYGVDA